MSEIPFNAVVYDVETFPNVFTLSACTFGNDADMFTFELSHRRDNRTDLIRWFNYLYQNRIPMIGFNNLAFDYLLIHMLYTNPQVSVADLYAKAMEIIRSQQYERFGQTIWEADRFAPQIDLLTIHHFDNNAKRTSLKALEFNMRSQSIQDMPVEIGTILTDDQIERQLIPYNRHDVKETNRFGVISIPNIMLRRELKSQLDGDVINFNDTKIGKQMFIQRLGDDLCYERRRIETGFNGEGYWKRVPRQTVRSRIALGEIIFPYIYFNHPEFRRVHDWLKQQVITETKGELNTTATINGFEFHFGTGGIHGSVTRKAIYSDASYAIIDIDVAALYPSIGIVNRLYPAHLGERFIEVWSDIVAERKKHKKGTASNSSLKLASNGPYGESNQPFSPLYDPQFTMTITINGQLLLCMLAEWLLTVPTLEIIQINTDGITYRIHRSYEARAKELREAWERFTMLTLEEARYGRMFIRDVNNYIAETEDRSKTKLKGAYWFPNKFPDDISNASPSAWYKDLSSPIIQRAAEAALLHGVSPDDFIWSHSNPFDFCIRAKVDRSSQLFIGETRVQRITRYFVAKNGAPMRKVSPPVAGAVIGEFKRKSKISEYDYYQISKEIGPGVWDARIHTANKSRYEDRTMSLQSGWLVAECNNMASFDWSNLDRRWYIEETRKLLIT